MARRFVSLSGLLGLCLLAGCNEVPDGHGWPLCARKADRAACVVDGDTIWYRQEKIRLSAIDAPEISQPKCKGEHERGLKAQAFLAAKLPEKPGIVRTGRDKYGRTLAKVLVNGRDVADLLIAEKLARPWRGRKESWCER